MRIRARFGTKPEAPRVGADRRNSAFHSVSFFPPLALAQQAGYHGNAADAHPSRFLSTPSTAWHRTEVVMPSAFVSILESAIKAIRLCRNNPD